MNVRHYVAMFDQSSWLLLAQLGLDSQYFGDHARGMAALEQTIQYKNELRSGDMFEIRSGVMEVREKTLRLLHNMYNVRTGALAASTTILGGVHTDRQARKSAPLPASIREGAQNLVASMCMAADLCSPQAV